MHSEQRREQVLPLRIFPFDQLNFPGPLPFLHAQFALSSLLQIVIALEPHQHRATMILREAVNQGISVLICPRGKIARHTDIRCRCACLPSDKHIRPSLRFSILDSCVRRNTESLFHPLQIDQQSRGIFNCVLDADEERDGLPAID